MPAHRSKLNLRSASEEQFHRLKKYTTNERRRMRLFGKKTSPPKGAPGADNNTNGRDSSRSRTSFGLDSGDSSITKEENVTADGGRHKDIISLASQISEVSGDAHFHFGYDISGDDGNGTGYRADEEFYPRFVRFDD